MPTSCNIEKSENPWGIFVRFFYASDYSSVLSFLILSKNNLLHAHNFAIWAICSCKLSTLWFIGWFLTGLCLYIHKKAVSCTKKIQAVTKENIPKIAREFWIFLCYNFIAYPAVVAWR